MSPRAPGSSGETDNALPTLGQAGPSVRFWSNMTGLSDAMCDDDDNEHLVSNVSGDNIAYNLQQMNDRERADAYLGLIQFLAMFMAELMRAIARANGPDVIVLLQGEVELRPHSPRSADGQREEEAEGQALMQTTRRHAPIMVFGKNLNSMPERVAREMARRLITMLDGVGAHEGMDNAVVNDRTARLRALLTAYAAPPREAVSSSSETWCLTQWNAIVPYLAQDLDAAVDEDRADANRAEASVATDREQGRSSQQVATNEGEGNASTEGRVLVQPLGQPWRVATAREQAELDEHDAYLREEQQELRQRDEEAWRMRQASVHQTWEDWVVGSAMQEDSQGRQRSRKRFKVSMKVQDRQLNELGSTMVEGEVPEDEEPLMQIIVETVGQTEAALVEPSTPDKVLVNHEDVPLPATVPDTTRHTIMDVEELSNIVHSQLGRSYYELWSSGQIGLETVRLRLGSQVAEMFQLHKDVEDNDTQLNQARSETTSKSSWEKEYFPDETEKTEVKVPAALRMMDAGSGHGLHGPDAHGPPQQWFHPKPERNGQSVTEAQEGVLPDEGGEALGGVGTEEQNMDVAEDETVPEGGETNLMQRGQPDFETVLQNLLNQLDSMPQPKAARMAEFLQQHLMDMRRPAPHLWRPVLRERHASVEALLSVFAEYNQALQAEEQQWCNRQWVMLVPFLEDDGCGRSTATGSDALPDGAPLSAGEPMALAKEEEVVAIEDSQEPVEEDGSQIQVARLGNGTVRDLLPEEVRQLQWNEMVEDEAAHQQLQMERDEWASLAASSFMTWEQWAAADQPVEPSVKRARVQVRIQGEGGRVVRDEQYLVALRDGEQLVYQVSVRTPVVNEAETLGAYAEEAVEAAAERASSSGDKGTPTETDGALMEPCDRPLEGDDKDDDKSHIDAEEFVASPLGVKFYREWKHGMVSPAVIGQRFGYHVLGKYASVLEDEKEAAEQRQVGATEAAAGSASGGFAALMSPPAHMFTLEDSLEEAAVAEPEHDLHLTQPEQALVAAHQEVSEMGAGAAEASHGEESEGAQSASGDATAASSTRTSEGLTSSASTERGSVFPRRHIQTSLKKWLA